MQAVFWKVESNFLLALEVKTWGHEWSSAFSHKSLTWDETNKRNWQQWMIMKWKVVTFLQQSKKTANQQAHATAPSSWAPRGLQKLIRKMEPN